MARGTKVMKLTAARTFLGSSTIGSNTTEHQGTKAIPNYTRLLRVATNNCKTWPLLQTRERAVAQWTLATPSPQHPRNLGLQHVCTCMSSMLAHTIGHTYMLSNVQIANN